MEKPDAETDIEVPQGPDYVTTNTTWQGIDLEVRHCARWLYSSGEFTTQHIEIRSVDTVPLPITSTGYRSCFLDGADALAEFDRDPVQYVHWILNEAAKSKEWLAQVEASRQLSFF